MRLASFWVEPAARFGELAARFGKPALVYLRPMALFEDARSVGSEVSVMSGADSSTRKAAD